MAEQSVSFSAPDFLPDDIQVAYESFRQDSPDQSQIDARRRLEERLEQRRLERELKEFDFEF